MKLLELVPLLEDYTRIKRDYWKFFLVRSSYDGSPLIKINLYSIEIGEYILSYNDLIADDWEIMK